jgi:hypothetical protein
VRRLMVKIRYAELPAGLHVVAEVGRRGTIIYLLPGLSPAQRQAALSRVRSSARMGHGPKMPALSMARAVAADRARTTVRNGAAALRRHPMVFLTPMIAVLVSAIVFMLMSFVTLTVTPDGKAAAAAVPTLGIGATQPAHGRTRSAGVATGQHKPALAGSPRRSRRHRRAASQSASGSPSTGPTAYLPASSPSPTRVPPPAGGRCIKLGRLRFCMRS